MSRDLVIIGCGGFGREVADVVDAINQVEPTWSLLGFLDDMPSPENIARVERRGSFVLGSVNSFQVEDAPHFAVGIGDAATRARIAASAEESGWVPATLVHPTAALGGNLMLGRGAIVCAHVAVGSDVTVGQHVHLDRGVQVGHDSNLHDFVTAHPSAVISGNCEVGAGVELGTTCTLLPGISIGTGSIVGAAACVTTDVAAHLVVVGTPARPARPAV